MPRGHRNHTHFGQIQGLFPEVLRLGRGDRLFRVQEWADLAGDVGFDEVDAQLQQGSSMDQQCRSVCSNVAMQFSGKPFAAPPRCALTKGNASGPGANSSCNPWGVPASIVCRPADGCAAPGTPLS
jgi:hypothetical protein